MHKPRLTLPRALVFWAGRMAMVTALFWLAAVPVNMAAQSTTSGDITGVVSDPSGAAIPGATVTITNNATGAAHTRTTDPHGNYRFSLLSPGEYMVAATATGFAPRKANVVVNVGQVSAANLRMQVGSATQTVTVTSE